MENIFEIEESSSEEESEDETIDRIAQSTKFLNKVPMSQYEKNRNKLFTKQIIKRNIVIDSQSYYFGPMPGHSVTKDLGARDKSGEEDAYASQGFQSVDFSTSNYSVPLQLRRNVSILGLPTPNFTADHGIFTNVIGFKLKKAVIRAPVYNVNKTNNVIVYISGFGDGYTTGAPVLSITISPGVYTAHELADVFQRYANNKYPGSGDTFNPAINAQFCVYNTINIGEYMSPEEAAEILAVPSGTWSTDSGGNETFLAAENSFTCKFMEERANDIGIVGGSDSFAIIGDAPDIGTNPNGYYRGMGFQFGYPGLNPHPASGSESAQAITVIWNYNSVTRAAAKLFGFLPQTRVSGLYQYSDKAPDLSSQYVDLVIPQIPSIACTKNSNGRDIIDRINLDVGHGEYVYYTPQEKDSEIQNYFSPIRISKLQIQLFAWNNEFYDSQNSDNSFEFEITMINDKRLLA